MTNILKSLFKDKVDLFKASYLNSRESFYDEEKKQLFHNLEFGTQREIICRNFLKYFIPQRLSIGSGFLINTKGQISTQIDIVIYDANAMPIIEDSNRQLFYPVECVVAIGEIKSKLSKTSLKKALIKLSEAKKLKENINYETFNFAYTHNKTKKSFTPKSDTKDQIYSFLICENFEFDPKKDFIEDSYKGIDTRQKHNIILSLADGVVCYHLGDNDSGEHSTIDIPEIYESMYAENPELKQFKAPANTPLRTKVIFPAAENSYSHFEVFCAFLYESCSLSTILRASMIDYFGGKIQGVSVAFDVWKD